MHALTHLLTHSLTDRATTNLQGVGEVLDFSDTDPASHALSGSGGGEEAPRVRSVQLSPAGGGPNPITLTLTPTLTLTLTLIEFQLQP